MASMKSEDNVQTTTTTFSAAQWGQQTNQIPIDPALQQQPQPQHTTAPYAHYQAYQHYSQASYHYQYAQQQQQPMQQPQAQPAVAPTTMATPVTAAPVVARQPMQSTLDTADVATLNDALGSAGVDLRAEEERLHGSFDQYHSYRPYEDRSRKQPVKPNFDTHYLGTAVREIGTKNKITKVPDDSVNYVALALRARLQDLLEAMIAASAHRTDTEYDKPPPFYENGEPMWNVTVRSDVARQLEVLERVEREEEIKVRRERKERAEVAAAHAAAALSAQNAGGTSMVVDSVGGGGGGEETEGGPKKKKKKDGPGVTARNMSEDVRKKMSNAVASQAAGLGTGKYAWMTAANVSTPPKPKAAAASTAGSGAGTLTPATTTAPAASAGSRWAKPYVSAKSSQYATPPKEEDNRRTVTLRDAMFVIEKEKGHGGGRGAARGWT